MEKIETGKFGEDLAKKFLIKNGYTVCALNFRAGRQGEVDIVAKKNGVYHFIEVKTRSNRNFGWPEEAVDQGKIDKIALAAESYLKQNELTGAWQIGIIGILLDRSCGQARLWHIKNV